MPLYEHFVDHGAGSFHYAALKQLMLLEHRSDVAIDHLRMRGDDDLAVLALGDIFEDIEDLTLSQDLKMGVGLVDEEDAPLVPIQIGEDQEDLLKAATGERNVEVSVDAFLPVLEYRLP